MKTLFLHLSSPTLRPPIFAHVKGFSLLCTAKAQQGSLAEWLGTGLQNRLRRFDSARNLR